MINVFIKEKYSFWRHETGVYYRDEEFEPKFEESVAEKSKLRRQNQQGQGLKILTQN